MPKHNFAMRRALRFGGALVTLLGATSAHSAALAAETQFDLKCEGTRQSAMDGPIEPYAYGYRIDLSAGKWCWDNCQRVYDIQETHPDRIVFEETRTEQRNEISSTWHEVSRVDGQHRLLNIQVRPLPRRYEVKGTCKPAAFSGFPQALF